MGALVRRKRFVLVPLGENQRYDLVFEEDGRFMRVQCKTGRLINGAVLFNTVSTHGHRGKPSRNYLGQVEYFGVYCPQLEKTYLVPIEDVTETNNKLTLRVEPTRNGQGKKIRWASAYELK
jgi:hypothetical protein